MDHSTIIKRAATITRRHRALWLFGFLVALTGGGSGGFGGSSNYSGNGGDFGGAPGAELRWPEGLPGRAFVDQLVQELSQRGQGLHFDPANPGWVLAGLVLICGGLLLLVLLAIGLNYVARAALMRMVDQIEARGESPGIGLGFELGWSLRTLRLFLLELLLGLLALVVMVPVLLLAIVPVGLLIGSEQANSLGLLIAVGLACLGLPLALALLVLWRLMSQMWSREVVVGNAPIGAAVADAWGLLRAQPMPLLLMWLIMLLLYLGFGVVMVPVLILLLGIAAAAAIGVGAAIFSAAGSALGALAAALPVFLFLLLVPLLILSGIYKVFESSAWTLAWRELRGAGSGGDDTAEWPAATPSPALPV